MDDTLYLFGWRTVTVEVYFLDLTEMMPEFYRNEFIDKAIGKLLEGILSIPVLQKLHGINKACRLCPYIYIQNSQERVGLISEKNNLYIYFYSTIYLFRQYSSKNKCNLLQGNLPLYWFLFQPEWFLFQI